MWHPPTGLVCYARLESLLWEWRCALTEDKVNGHVPRTSFSRSRAIFTAAATAVVLEEP